MEKEIEELKQEKWLDNQIIEKTRSKLSELELREKKLKEYNLEATRTVEELRRWILACEEKKKTSDRIQEEMKQRESNLRRQNLEATRIVDELRRQKLEAERANEVMAQELLKANDTCEEMRRALKELKRQNLKAYEMHTVRFENLVPIAIELGKLLKMNVEDLVKLKNKFIEDEVVTSTENTVRSLRSTGDYVEKGYSGLPQKAGTSSSADAVDIIKIIDCDDETSPGGDACFSGLRTNLVELETIHKKLVSNPSANQMNKRKNCSDISPIIPRRKRSKRGVGANNSSIKETMYGADMLKAFVDNDELCLHAVCVLYRKQVSASKSNDDSDKVLYHFESMRGRALAESLINGDPELRLTKTVAEVKQHFPDILKECRRLAMNYSSYFAMSRITSLDQNNFSLTLFI